MPIAASALLSCGGETAAPARDIAFTDVGRESGIDFEHHNGFAGNYYYFETFGSGAAFIDYDGDGWLDIYLVDGAVLSGDDIEPTPVNKLYRSDGGQRFVDVSASVGAADTGYGMGCAIADYDNDGDQDLFVANYGTDAFFRNDDGSFLDVTDESGLGDSRWATSAGFLDYDNDGDLDLYVTAYVDFEISHNKSCQKGRVRSYCEPEAYDPVRDILYRNDDEGGHPAFVDVRKTLANRSATCPMESDSPLCLYWSNPWPFGGDRNG